jgi:hypothetical protein
MKLATSPPGRAVSQCTEEKVDTGLLRCSHIMVPYALVNLGRKFERAFLLERDRMVRSGSRLACWDAGRRCAGVKMD